MKHRNQTKPLSRLFFQLLGFVPRRLSSIGITVSIMFHVIFNSRAKSRLFVCILLFFILSLLSVRWNSNIQRLQVHFFTFSSTLLLVETRWCFLFSSRDVLMTHFQGVILFWVYTLCKHVPIIISGTIPSE